MVKICPICRQQFQTKAQLAAHMSSVHPTRQARQQFRTVASGSQSTMMLSRKELVSTFSVNDVNIIEIFPGKSGCPMLDSFAQNYEDFKIVSWSTSIKPTVGTQTDGSYTIGYSYGSTMRPTTAHQIAALSPSTSNPCYVPCTLAVNPRRIMGQPWLPTYAKDGPKSPGAVVIKCTKEIQIWVNYKVIFSGPTAVRRDTFDSYYEFDSNTRKWTDETGNVINRVQYDQSVNLQIDVGTSVQNVFQSIITTFDNLFVDYQRIHQVFNRVIGSAHWILSNVNIILPTLAAPVILHVQRRPFPRILGRLLELGYRAPESYDPGIRSPSCDIEYTTESFTGLGIEAEGHQQQAD